MRPSEASPADGEKERNGIAFMDYKKWGGWPMELETKPDFDAAIERVYAWFEGELLDRPPIRFSRHNAEYDGKTYSKTWPSLKDRWFDTEYVVDSFVEECRHKRFHAETFPMFWPNLGPNVFAACYGTRYEFGDVTAWTVVNEDPDENDEYDYSVPAIDWNSPYLKKLDEMTDYALEKCKGTAMVGYTDIHPGMDWAVAIKGNQPLLMGLYSDPDEIAKLGRACLDDFIKFYDHFDKKLKAAGQMSTTWMNIPCFGRMHIPSCDFSTMIKPEHFMQFAYDTLAAECSHMTHNIFHVDGKGVARHTDAILTLPNLTAIQWVQGVGDDAPMLQWVPYIQKVQASGKGIICDVSLAELDAFMDAVRPKGIFLCVATESEEQELEVIKKAEHWR